MSILDRLFKSKQEIAPKEDATVPVEGQEVQKSFDEALDEVSKILKAKPAFLNKKKKEDDPEEDHAEPDEDNAGGASDDDEDNEGDEDEDGEDAFVTNRHKMKKSEEEIFVDAEPIIKSLMGRVMKSIEKVNARIDSMEEIQKAMADLSVTQGSMLKSIQTVKSGVGQPLERKGVVSETVDRPFTKSADGKVSLSKAQATDKLQALIKAQKVSTVEVAMIEKRINLGGELPPVMFEDIK